MFNFVNLTKEKKNAYFENDRLGFNLCRYIVVKKCMT